MGPEIVDRGGKAVVEELEKTVSPVQGPEVGTWEEQPHLGPGCSVG